MSAPGHGERVLSTLNEDGTRRWLTPRLARGKFLTGRRIVGFSLIVLFVVLPRIRIGGRPALLVDLITREISVFGTVFRPSDGFVLMLLGLTIVIAVFLVTALFGRVWCGWACPQSVYLEHVFRPIERRFKKHPVVKWGLYIGLSFALSNVFLAYFVGTDRLEQWVFESPLQHPGGFAVVVGVAGLMLFDFAWFREQVCIVACPYGRLQAVLLDKQSLIIGYDAKRGEPRGKPKKKLPVLAERGDCIDCAACVVVCPTGIDIRDGLQMECIGCAQCADACDHVMAKLGKPPKLIGYTSQDQLEGKPRRLLRTRTVVYPAMLVVVASLLVWGVGSRPTTDVVVERTSGPSFVVLPDGRISAQARIKLENHTDEDRHYSIQLARTTDAELRLSQAVWLVKPRKSIEIVLFVDAARSTYVNGERKVQLRINDDQGFERVVEVTLLGPAGDAR